MSKKMVNKKAIEFSFSWLFAILAGAFIIFLAVYGVTKLIQSQNYAVDTETAKKLSIIFDPMETGLATGKRGLVSFNTNTKVYDKCTNDGIFGKQKFSVSSFSLGKWSKPGAEIDVVNKYVFSSATEEGKEFSWFSLNFNFPYKISELILFSGKKYCFVNAPNFVENDISGLNLKNIYISDEITNKTCIPGTAKVCFSGNCDINIVGLCSGYGCESEFDYGYVEKSGKKLYYSGNLLYAAVFSDVELYECNVKRLMRRGGQIAYLYYDEANFLASKCGNEISADLIDFGNSLSSVNSSSELIFLQDKVKQIENKNMALECELW